MIVKYLLVLLNQWNFNVNPALDEAGLYVYCSKSCDEGHTPMYPYMTYIFIKEKYQCSRYNGP
jgi:hypothetical protein